MGTSLNGLTPAGTYPGLIKTGDNAPIDGTLKTLSDGNGNNLPMSVSTTTINLTGTAQVGGVAIANTTQLAAKQDTLVSGTNIKTINGTSLLGSGNIPVVTSPSGVAGAIQFSNGSAFASDAANLFWDDTNNRLGVGTNNPYAATFQVKGGGADITTNAVFVENSVGLPAFIIRNNGTVNLPGNLFAEADISVGSSSSLGARLGIKGSGSTSATTSLLVQNSGGTTALSVKDDLSVTFGGNALMNRAYLTHIQYVNASNTGLFPSSEGWLFAYDNATSNIQIARLGYQGTKEITASLQVDSTTQGFLPPRMTTTQRDAIATPATGLKVYNTTTNTTDTYDGTTWQRFGQQTLIKGSGSTSATTSLLVQNSAGTELLKVQDDGSTSMGTGNAKFISLNSSNANFIRAATTYLDSPSGYFGSFVYNGFQIGNGSSAPHASAIIDATSTTQGFLPPRMTTTQKNAIASPASGLIVYDTTTNKLCCYNGSTWNDLF